jgi:hypothetical protein
MRDGVEVTHAQSGHMLIKLLNGLLTLVTLDEALDGAQDSVFKAQEGLTV